LGLEFRHVEDDHFSPLQAQDSAVDKPAQVARDQVADRADFPNLFVGLMGLKSCFAFGHVNPQYAVLFVGGVLGGKLAF
jgi:hypothetical protein